MGSKVNSEKWATKQRRKTKAALRKNQRQSKPKSPDAGKLKFLGY